MWCTVSGRFSNQNDLIRMPLLLAIRSVCVNNVSTCASFNDGLGKLAECIGAIKSSHCCSPRCTITGEAYSTAHDTKCRTDWPCILANATTRVFDSPDAFVMFAVSPHSAEWIETNPIGLVLFSYFSLALSFVLSVSISLWWFGDQSEFVAQFGVFLCALSHQTHSTSLYIFIYVT